MEAIPENRVGALLRQQGLTLSTAESCTGGLLGHRLTNVPGSSDYYLGGVVAYANAVKIVLLGVDGALLADEGAVNEAVARQMARGVRRLLGADIGIGITGIAGPTGASPGKPLGLVYIALAAEGDERCERHVWPHDRLGNKQASVERALGMILQFLETAPRRQGTIASLGPKEGIEHDRTIKEAPPPAIERPFAPVADADFGVVTRRS